MDEQFIWIQMFQCHFLVLQKSAEYPAFILTTPTLANLDNNPGLETVIGTAAGRLHILDQEGRAVSPFPLPTDIIYTRVRFQLFKPVPHFKGCPSLYRKVTACQVLIVPWHIPIFSVKNNSTWCKKITQLDVKKQLNLMSKNNSTWCQKTTQLPAVGPYSLFSMHNNSDIVFRQLTLFFHIIRLVLLLCVCHWCWIKGLFTYLLDSWFVYGCIQVIVEDVNRDGRAELILQDLGGNVLCYDSDGNRLWETPVSGSKPMDMRVADVDEDGRLEIVVVCEDGYESTVL